MNPKRISYLREAAASQPDEFMKDIVNECLDEIEPKDPKKIHEAIVEILVKSQYNFWVEPISHKMTATQINSRPQRAIEYYLGRTDHPMSISSIEQNQFHVLINVQADAIMRKLGL